MVQTAVALRPGSGHQLCGECTERNHDIAFSGCGRDNAHVLVMQVDPETRFEIASKHASRLAFEDSASREAAGEHRDGSLGVYPVRAQENDGLGNQLDVSRNRSAGSRPSRSGRNPADQPAPRWCLQR